MKKDLSIGALRDTSIVTLSLIGWQFAGMPAEANPMGGTVAGGSASFNTSGSQLTINTSANAVINWQSFNIGVGETTTFNQPSSTSVVWNQISDPNPSQLLGTLNANGYVVLQNQSGFVVGGGAVINAHGLVLSTASSPAPNLASGGAWEFDAPPPLAKIINYGQINLAGGGQVFLIASDIENYGTISAEQGKIGLYSGQTVLVSMSPDGRGLSAQVTLPQGSVDNEGKLIADAGAIVAQAQTVNQNGLVQANSVQNVNGTIELLASDSVNLGANSSLSAQGDSQGVSSGGAVTIKSDNTFSDQAGSTINIAGGSQGGNGGQLEISSANLSGIQSQIIGGAASGFQGGKFTIDPTELDLTSSFVSTLTPILGSGLYQINLQADDTITLDTLWTLANPGGPALLTLNAGNNIIFNNGTGIKAAVNWSVDMTAGTSLVGTPAGPLSDGIYLVGSSVLQTQNGNINLWAANELIVGSDTGGNPANGTGAIRTLADGNISVTTEFGDVNTGGNVNGYTFALAAPPFYRVNAANLGGISTAAGGDVDITAGGDVISYLPRQSDYANGKTDAGTGAFGPQAGNVNISAGGNVYGHYVLANGVGTITADGDIGAPIDTLTADPTKGFALSLIKGSWNVLAPNGSIFVQDVRNPNGIFGEKLNGSGTPANPGFHLFDYDPSASVAFTAGDAVEITGFDAPNTPPLSTGGNAIPSVFPPMLSILAGSGGIALDTDVILFPSPNQDLRLITLDGGNLGIPNSSSPYSSPPVTLEMSDSGSKQWTSTTSFATSDQSPTLIPQNNPNPIQISISGSINDLNLYTTRETQITVGGDMINCGFNGQNLRPGDVSSLNVKGQIFNSPLYAFTQLSGGITSANPLQPSAWDSVFVLAINPAMAAALANLDVNSIPNGTGLANLALYLKQHDYLLFPSAQSSTGDFGVNPGFVYDAAAGLLGFKGVMTQILSPIQIAALENGSFTVLVADSHGNPLIVNGHLETMTYTFGGAPAVATLDTESSTSIADNINPIGYQLGGPGQFDISASSINLGNTPGIQSVGFSFNQALAPLLPVAAEGGASVNVNVTGDLNMITSSIDSQDGGDVSVNAGGDINLSEGTGGNYFDFRTFNPYGIYTSGHSDVNVTADGDINVGNARIATFNGGNVFVESFNGDVNVGTGANAALVVEGFKVDPDTGLPISTEIGVVGDAATLLKNPAPYGSGILSEMPTAFYQSGGVSQPGNITVETPNGNIVSTSGGISQIALNGSVEGPSVTLSAGTKGVTSPHDPNAGNILLGVGGVVGGNVNVAATGQIQGFFVSQENLNVTGQTFSGFGLAGQTANVSANEAGSGPAIVVGLTGVNANGLGTGATLLGQNVSANGGAAQSTLGTSVNASAASQNAAAVSNNDAKQEVADNGDDENKKKKIQPLMQRVKRVTVILPKVSAEKAGRPQG